MKLNINQIDDCKTNQESSREKQISTDLVCYFRQFWVIENLDKKSKTTKYRYSNSLHALGGYLIDQSNLEKNYNKSAQDLLLEYVGPYGGPLIHDIENWQNELDMVCCKFYKYMKKAELYRDYGCYSCRIASSAALFDSGKL